MIYLLIGGGFVVFVLMVSVVVAGIQSAHSKSRYSVDVDLLQGDRAQGSIRARFDTEEDAIRFAQSIRAKLQVVEPHDARGRDVRVR